MYPEGMTTQGKYSNNPCTDDGTITRKSANDIESCWQEDSGLGKPLSRWQRKEFMRKKNRWKSFLP
jgi:hypothetical protein